MKIPSIAILAAYHFTYLAMGLPPKYHGYVNWAVGQQG